MKKESIILFGSTDFTYDLLNHLLQKRIKISGIVTIKNYINISYSKKNHKYKIQRYKANCIRK